MTPVISGIIPTMCTRERGSSLMRAIDSLHNASVEPLEVIVVVNGEGQDPDVLASLNARHDVTVLRSALPGLTNALTVGRSRVSSAFYCFLDDDDEMLDGGLDERLSLLRRRPEVDLAVSTGWREVLGERTLMRDNIESVSTDPLLSLFQGNWLASCGGLFRASSVGPEYFARPYRFLEWTWLAFQLAKDGKTIGTTPTPAFCVHDTPDSVSKSVAYRLAHAALYDQMLSLCDRGDVRRILRSRRAAAAHAASDEHLRMNQLALAWRWHLRSLRDPVGWRYMSYTGRLMLAGARLSRTRSR